MLLLTSICPALVLLFLAGWVHRDISTGNIIVVESGGSLRGLLSDLEYAKATGTQGSSPDPKTVCFDVKYRFFLTFDQGTPYFMPLEIHRGKKFTSGPNARVWTLEELKNDIHSHLSQRPKLPKAILRYTSNHDQESLMWVALWIVYGLVDWDQAKKIRTEIFKNTHSPSMKREEFFREGDSLDGGEFFEAFHPELRPGYPQYFHLLQRQLYAFCILSEPTEEDYHNLINSLSFVFDKLLATVDGKSGIVPLVVQSGTDNQANDEVERSRNNTEHILYSSRSHVRNSGPPHLRFRRQY